MEVIRVQPGGTSADAELFASLLNEQHEQMKRLLHNPLEDSIQVSREQAGQYHEFVVRGKPHDHVVNTVAEAAAAYIVEVFEKEIVRGLIAEECATDNPVELQQIEAYCWHNSDPLQEVITSDNTGKENRKKLIVEEIKQYLDDQRLMNLEGLVRFRLHPYMEQLHEIVEYAIDEYTADKQYEEFISLLKYFVYIQEAKIPAAHLIHRGGQDFTLLDEKMEPIETKQLDQFVVEMIDKEMNVEDMIVSTLISVSPQNVFIHTRHPELQVIKTIRQIFEERADVCTSCPRCRPILGDFKHHDHYYR